MKSIFKNTGLHVLAIALVIGAYLISNSTWNISNDKDQEYYHKISVQWEWKVFVQPDVMYLSLSIEHTEKTSQEAQTKVNEKINQIKEILKEKNIEDKDIKSTHINLQPEYERASPEEDYNLNSNGRKKERRILIWYKASHNINVTFRDLKDSNVTKTLDLLTEKVDGLNIANLSFDLEDKTEAYSKARNLAVKKAQQKAKELTEELDISLWKVVSVNESSYFVPYATTNSMTQSFSANVGGSYNSNISLWELELIRNVNITYEIE